MFINKGLKQLGNIPIIIGRGNKLRNQNLFSKLLSFFKTRKTLSINLLVCFALALLMSLSSGKSPVLMFISTVFLYAFVALLVSFFTKKTNWLGIKNRKTALGLSVIPFLLIGILAPKTDGQNNNFEIDRLSTPSTQSQIPQPDVKVEPPIDSENEKPSGDSVAAGESSSPIQPENSLLEESKSDNKVVVIPPAAKDSGKETQSKSDSKTNKKVETKSSKSDKSKSKEKTKTDKKPAVKEKAKEKSKASKDKAKKDKAKKKPAKSKKSVGKSSYKNCKDVWSKLGRPIYKGERGYSRKLDRDGDGVGCERRPR